MLDRLAKNAEDDEAVFALARLGDVVVDPLCQKLSLAFEEGSPAWPYLRALDRIGRASGMSLAVVARPDAKLRSWRDVAWTARLLATCAPFVPAPLADAVETRVLNELRDRTETLDDAAYAMIAAAELARTLDRRFTLQNGDGVDALRALLSGERCHQREVAAALLANHESLDADQRLSLLAPALREALDAPDPIATRIGGDLDRYVLVLAEGILANARTSKPTQSDVVELAHCAIAEGHEDAELRRRAAHALGAGSTQRGLAALRRALGDRDRRVVLAALSAVAERGKGAAPLKGSVRRLMIERDADAEIRAGCVRALRNR